MPVRVDELTTDVSVEHDRPVESGGASSQRRWEHLESAKATRERLARDEERTRAEGYCD
jgi:hypothetical protein